MKKSISLLLVFCVIACFSLFRLIADNSYACELCEARKYLPDRVVGDLNLDGEINSVDCVIMKAYLLGIYTNLENDKERFGAADINSDGNVNSIDYAILRKYLLGMGELPTPSPKPMPSVTPTPRIITESGYEFNLDTGTIVKCVDNYVTVTIPSELRGVKVKAIGDKAFSSCKYLTSLTISEGISCIGSEAFSGCENLVSVTLPNSINCIDSNAFEGCKELKKAIFMGNEPEYMGNNVFADVHPDFTIIVSADSAGFGKPNPYNSETLWEWSVNSNPVYNVVLAEDEIIVFKSEYLRLVILDKIGKNEYDIIYKNEADKITELSLFKPIDLSELSKFPNLDYLIIGLISEPFDISPLANLKNLTRLDIFDSDISDISPLKNLTNLTFLRLIDNNISDISPLENLTELSDLDLCYNKISDISPLKNLTNLTYLSLSYNNISDISPLENLTNLAYLKLDCNNITDITPLKNLVSLKSLDIRGNNIEDLTPLEKLNELIWLYY